MTCNGKATTDRHRSGPTAPWVNPAGDLLGQLQKVVVIGSTGFDSLHEADRLDGVKLTLRKLIHHGCGGAGHNVSVVLSMLGGQGRRVLLLSNTGNDATGRRIRRELNRRGIETPIPPLSDFRTGRSLIVTAPPSASSLILTRPGARSAPVILDRLEQAASGCDALCIAGHPVNEQLGPILRIAARHHVPFVALALHSAQINGLTSENLQEVFEGVEPLPQLIACNHHEAGRFTGRQDPDDQLRALQFGDPHRIVLVTHGADGINARQDVDAIHEPAYSDGRPVVDETGAGDACFAAAVDALLKGLTLREALKAGARQGFEVTTAFGATSFVLNAC